MPRKTVAKKTADTHAPKRTESGGVKHTTDDGIPASRTDTKDETRLFQRGNGPKVWLTRDEAKNEGFFWNDNPEENVNPPN